MTVLSYIHFPLSPLHTRVSAGVSVSLIAHSSILHTMAQPTQGPARVDTINRLADFATAFITACAASHEMQYNTEPVVRSAREYIAAYAGIRLADAVGYGRDELVRYNELKHVASALVATAAARNAANVIPNVVGLP